MKVWVCQRPKRRLGRQPLAARAATAQAGRLGGHRRLVDEHQASRAGPHARPALLDPVTPSLTNVGARLLRGHQGFFICEAGLTQHPRQRGGTDRHAANRRQFGGQLGHGDVGLGLDAGDQEIPVRRQLAATRRPTLSARKQRTGLLNPRNPLHRATVAAPQMPGPHPAADGLARPAPRSAPADPRNNHDP